MYTLNNGAKVQEPNSHKQYTSRQQHPREYLIILELFEFRQIRDKSHDSVQNMGRRGCGCSLNPPCCTEPSPPTLPTRDPRSCILERGGFKLLVSEFPRVPSKGYALVSICRHIQHPTELWGFSNSLTQSCEAQLERELELPLRRSHLITVRTVSCLFHVGLRS